MATSSPIETDAVTPESDSRENTPMADDRTSTTAVAGSTTSSQQQRMRSSEKLLTTVRFGLR